MKNYRGKIYADNIKIADESSTELKAVGNQCSYILNNLRQQAFPKEI